MSVFLNSTPQEDGAALNGGAVSMGNIPGVWFVADYNVFAYRESSQTYPQYLDMAAGGQFVAVFDRNGTYLQSGDTGFSFRWKIWARGSGTLDLTQDTDEDWDTTTLPTPSIGSLVINSTDYELYHVTAAPIVLAEFLAFDGIRLGLELASGDINITTIQLECVPDSGTTGWWATRPSFDNEDNEVNSGRGSHTDVGMIGALSPVDYGTAGELALDATIAADILNSTGVDTIAGAFISAGAESWYRTGFDVGASMPYGHTNMTAAYISVDVAATLDYPVGVLEGTDFIRVPGYVLYDTYAYTRSAANHENRPTSVIAWDTPHLVYQRNLHFGGDPTLQNEIIVYLGDYVRPADTPTGFIPVAAGDPVKTITSSSPTIETETTTLPSSGKFTVWIMSRQLTTTVGGPGGLVLGDPSVAVAEYFGAGVTVQSDPVGEINEHKPLTYTIHYDAYAVWDPFATPPEGGQLKVWLPSEEWRVIGNEAGSATERLKIQTPDLTWWKEYRTVDGAVTTHPLMIYTEAGWIVAANMTPD